MITNNQEVYRDTLSRLREVFKGKEVITLNACARYMGRDPRTLLQDKKFPAKKIGNQYSVPLISLAHYLAV